MSKTVLLPQPDLQAENDFPMRNALISRIVWRTWPYDIFQAFPGLFCGQHEHFGTGPHMWTKQTHSIQISQNNSINYAPVRKEQGQFLCYDAEIMLLHEKRG